MSPFDCGSGVTQAGEVGGEGVRNATSATAAATAQAERAVGEAGEAVQQTARQALSQASDVADDMLAAGRHAVQAATRQVDEQPLMGGDRWLRPWLHRELVDTRAPVSR